ncbi:MAG: flagellar M-ring protein FliF [Kangiellaceae bacterium]|jgi:flagellar M-ring protein FliF|nr:flagellar M-ring protein FliF [Kangiellaceae bacterium]|tara:strand:- start:6947 stop:8656 length:1710 start_codon:yes stop_codon:yes gene_type:complete
MAESTQLQDIDAAEGKKLKRVYKTGFLANLLTNVSELPIMRQVGVMVGLAAAISVAAFIIFWSQEPQYEPISSRDPRIVREMKEFLEANNFKYKLDSKGTLLVPAKDVVAIKLELAGSDLDPWQEDQATDFLEKESGFGVSQRMEKARLLRTRETQLGQTIQQINAVKHAKVHLAIPKETIFARHRQPPSASVMLNLHHGRRLSQEEIDTIVNLVASSVPGMSAKNVTVVDQRARLLNAGSMDNSRAATRMEFEAEQQRALDLKQRIDSLLNQVVGMHKFTAEVDVDMDFTERESTQKSYNPDLPAVRSEFQIEDKRTQGGAQGVPGALSNQPPTDADIPQVVEGGNANNASVFGNSRKEVTRNYELDTTVTHQRRQVGQVGRISVSIGIDYMRTVDEQGEEIKVPRSPEELANIRRLVKGAVGLDLQRGDVLEVVNFPFAPEEPVVMPEVPWWEQIPFLGLLIEKGWGVLIAFVIGLMIIRTIVMLAKPPKPIEEDVSTIDDDLPDDVDDVMADQEAEIEKALGPIENPFLPGPLGADQAQLAAVRSIVGNDPAIVAQVIKEWIEQDA